ncbi:MAG: hypothetical protein ACXWQ6_05265 [Candidatus Limnocylindrales bacterium]
MATMANDASRQLVEDAQMIVRDLHFKRLAETLQPIDEAIRRTLETCLRRGIQCGDASPEEREFAARLGISV